MPQATVRFDAIGTRWSIDTPEPLPTAVHRAVLDRIDAYDQAWSRFRPDARIAPLATAAGSVRMPAESAELAELYRTLYAVTGGAVTPLVGGALEHLGYGTHGVAVTGREAVPPPSWPDALEWHGTTVTASQPIVLDVGAAGKGQVIDAVAEVLAAHGVSDAVVDASGDLVHMGSGDAGRATRVALEDPRGVDRAIGVVEVQREALCCSASNRRRWGARHHILDGRTGEPSDDVLATWVVADRAMIADGLATALWFAPASALLRHWSFEYARMFASGHVEATGRFVAGLHIRRGAA